MEKKKERQREIRAQVELVEDQLEQILISMDTQHYPMPMIKELEEIVERIKTFTRRN